MMYEYFNEDWTVSKTKTHLVWTLLLSVCGQEVYCTHNVTYAHTCPFLFVVTLLG